MKAYRAFISHFSFALHDDQLVCSTPVDELYLCDHPQACFFDRFGPIADVNSYPFFWAAVGKKSGHSRIEFRLVWSRNGPDTRYSHQELFLHTGYGDRFNGNIPKKLTWVSLNPSGRGASIS
jgi:hypothetical protein